MQTGLDAATMMMGMDSDQEVESCFMEAFFESWGIDPGRHKGEKRWTNSKR